MNCQSVTLMSHRPDSGLFYLATSLLYLLSCAVFASVNRALSAHPVSQGIYSQAGIYRQVLPVISRSERERERDNVEYWMSASPPQQWEALGVTTKISSLVFRFAP